jgi:hypothetical protein
MFHKVKRNQMTPIYMRSNPGYNASVRKTDTNKCKNERDNARIKEKGDDETWPEPTGMTQMM